MEINKMILTCKNGQGGFVSEKEGDGFRIYVCGPYSFFTDGLIVDKTKLGEFDFDESKLNVSCLFEEEECLDKKELLAKSSDVTLSTHILEKGKLNSRNREDLNKYQSYIDRIKKWNTKK